MPEAALRVCTLSNRRVPQHRRLPRPHRSISSGQPDQGRFTYRATELGEAVANANRTESTKISHGERQPERWPALAAVNVRHRVAFAYTVAN
jgi:hypothetical protein